MKNKIEVSYSELLNLRRQLRFNPDIPNVLMYEKFADNSGYELFLGLQTYTASHFMTNPSDISHFEQYVKPFCNKLDLPNMMLLSSHDYADNNTWMLGASNSLFVVAPSSGKEFIFHSVLGKLNKDVSFSSGQSFRFVIWQSLSETACPALGSTKTSFETPLYNPAGGVYTGWHKAYPPSTQEQKPNLWIYFNNNIPTHSVTEFVFENVDDFLEQASYSYEGSTVSLKYKYKDFYSYLNLRSSMNERLEMYMSNNNDINNPLGATTKAILSCVILEYDEF